MIKYNKIGLLSLLLTLPAVQNISAQESNIDSLMIEEVVVTAQKKAAMPPGRILVQYTPLPRQARREAPRRRAERGSGISPREGDDLSTRACFLGRGPSGTGANVC